MIALPVSLTREALQVGYLADSVYDTCGSYFNAGANVVTVKAAMEAAEDEVRCYCCYCCFCLLPPLCACALQY